MSLKLTYGTNLCITSLIVLLIAILQSCSSFSGKKESEEIVFRVNDIALTRDELNSLLKHENIPPDSALMVYQYLRSFAIEQLLWERAEDNIRDHAYIDSMVSGFRRSLVIAMYEDRLVKERLATKLTQEELRDYYEKNTAYFVLKNNLVKGVFLKIPAEAPKSASVKEWMRKLSPEDIEKIEKYSILNAQIYDYFLDKWVDMSELLRAMPPVSGELQEELLRKGRLIEASDEHFIYLLRIEEYKLKGEQEPFESALPRIEEILLNRKKNDFISGFRNELYERALESKKVKLPSE